MQPVVVVETADRVLLLLVVGGGGYPGAGIRWSEELVVVGGDHVNGGSGFSGGGAERSSAGKNGFAREIRF